MSALQADENFPQPAAELLRSFGHDVLTLLDAEWRAKQYPTARCSLTRRHSSASW